MEPNHESHTGGRRLAPVLMLFAVFLFPLVGGWLLYTFPALVPTGRTNHGELVQPPRQLPAVALTSLQPDVIATQDLLGKWLLVWTPPADCGANCAAGVVRLTQLYLAVGKDGPRLRRVVIGSGEPSVWNELDRDYTGTVFVTGPEPSVQRLLLTLQGTDDRREAYYFIDPAGTIVMRYPASANPKGMLKDLERLLKYSWLG